MIEQDYLMVVYALREPVFAALDACGREAAAAGLTEEDVEAELAAHKRERRT